MRPGGVVEGVSERLHGAAKLGMQAVGAPLRGPWAPTVPARFITAFMSNKDAHVEAYLNGSAFGSSHPASGVTDALIRNLRMAIIGGIMHPGQKLRESDLCRIYDVSRATVREALRILESERLIELIPNRGPFVARLGIREIEEIHDVWAMLTGETVYRFAERCGPEDLEGLEACLDKLRAAIASEQPLAQLEATNDFFHSILKKAANRILSEMTIGLVSRLMFLRAQSLHHRGWGLLYVEEIEDIVEAIRLRSPEDARIATRRHIGSACAAAKQVAAAANRNIKAAAGPVLADIYKPGAKASREKIG